MTLKDGYRFRGSINNLRNSAIQSDEIILFYTCGNTGHYQSTMTPNRDVLTPNRDVMSAYQFTQ